MFAHQVIEFLKNDVWFRDDEAMREGLIKSIKNSQQFHMGSSSNLLSFQEHIKEEGAFIGEYAVDIRLPYKLTWFDWILDSNNEFSISESILSENFYSSRISKIGALTWEYNKNEIGVIMFSYIDIYKKWLMPEIAYKITFDPKRELSGNIEPLMFNKYSDEEFKKIFPKIQNSGGELAFMLNASLLLLSCKNISIKRCDPSYKLNKHRIKKGRQPLFSYYTLIIKPMTLKEKSIPQNLWENRIHLCRGHFKTYTEEHPLFGRLTGRYWWQAQARGNKKLGIVVKDYEIITKEE